MRTISCTVEGLEDLERALLDRTVKQARAGMREALNAGGDILKAAIETRAPRRTGFLASHILKKLKLSAREDEGAVSVGPSKDAFYAQFVEFGSIHNKPPNPFIRSGFEESKQGALDAFISKLRDALAL